MTKKIVIQEREDYYVAELPRSQGYRREALRAAYSNEPMIYLTVIFSENEFGVNSAAFYDYVRKGESWHEVGGSNSDLSRAVISPSSVEGRVFGNLMKQPLKPISKNLQMIAALTDASI